MTWNPQLEGCKNFNCATFSLIIDVVSKFLNLLNLACWLSFLTRWLIDVNILVGVSRGY